MRIKSMNLIYGNWNANERCLCDIQLVQSVRLSTDVHIIFMLVFTNENVHLRELGKTVEDCSQRINFKLYFGRFYIIIMFAARQLEREQPDRHICHGDNRNSTVEFVCLPEKCLLDGNSWKAQDTRQYYFRLKQRSVTCWHWTVLKFTLREQ